MNVVIIEDELPARAKLLQLLSESVFTVKVIAQLGSVKESIKWFSNNPLPDLVFVDIQLADDHSFEIFKQTKVNCPIVFTTAYDKYLLESFEYNCIDYLLKPISKEKLYRSIEKTKTLEKHFTQSRIENIINPSNASSDVRIIGKKGSEFIALTPYDVAYFYTEHKVVFARDHKGKNLIVDYTLSNLEEILTPFGFFRINRKFLAHKKAIARFKSDHGKVLIHLFPAMVEPIHVSKETAPAFRNWIEGN